MRMRKIVAEIVAVTIVLGNGVALLPMFSAAQLAPLPDMVLRWNEVLLDAQVIDHTPGAGVPGAGLKRNAGPTRAARAMAIVHVAIYDAVNAIDRTHTPVSFTETAPATSSVEAAIIMAAHDTLVSLYPDQVARFDANMTDDLALIPDGQPKIDGIAIGQAAAAACIASRINDGSQNTVTYNESDQPGHWRPDPLHPDQMAYAAEYGLVLPFGMGSVEDFAAPAVPALTSAEYTAAYNEVKSLGDKNSTTRTQDQTNIGLFWGYDGTPGLGVPPRLYNQIGRHIAEQQGNTQVENARMFMLMNAAMADAGITSWKTKYVNDFWRPITGIRESDVGTGPTGLGDGNPDTIGDPNWEPLGAPASNPQLSSTPGTPPTNFTPPFPAYTSGHATFGAAFFETLKNFYGNDDIAFTFTSDELNGQTIDADGNVRPLAPRSFASFSQAAVENARSRIYLGIHWSFDADQGIAQGRALADAVFAHIALPLPSTDLSATITGPELVLENASFDATVGVQNNGLLVANNVIVTTAVPANFTFDSQASDPRCTIGQSNIISCAVGGEAGLAPQATATFLLRFTAGTELCATTAALVTSVDATEADGNLLNNSAQLAVYVGCPTESQVQLHTNLTGSDRIFRGNEISYELSVTNDGPATAANVRATLPLSTVALSPTGNPVECTQVGAEVICTGFTLTAGSSRTFSLKVATTLESVCPQDVTTFATVTSDAEDFYVNDNESDDVVTHVECEPVSDVAITTFTGPSSQDRGSTVVYAAIAKNYGPATASNVVISLPLPAGVTFQNSNPSGCAQVGANVECAIASLGIDATAAFDIAFAPLPSFECGGTISTSANVRASERDSEPGNNQSNAVVTSITCRETDSSGTNEREDEDADTTAQRSEKALSHSHRGHGTTEAAVVMAFLARNHNMQITDNGGQDQAQARLVGHFAFASDASRVFALKMDPFGVRKRNVAYAPYSEDELSVVCGMRDYLHQEAHMNRMKQMMPWVIEKLSAMLHRDPADIKAAMEGEATCKA